MSGATTEEGEKRRRRAGIVLQNQNKNLVIVITWAPPGENKEYWRFVIRGCDLSWEKDLTEARNTGRFSEYTRLTRMIGDALEINRISELDGFSFYSESSDIQSPRDMCIIVEKKDFSLPRALKKIMGELKRSARGFEIIIVGERSHLTGYR